MVRGVGERRCTLLVFRSFGSQLLWPTFVARCHIGVTCRLGVACTIGQMPIFCPMQHWCSMHNCHMPCCYCPSRGVASLAHSHRHLSTPTSPPLGICSLPWPVLVIDKWCSLSVRCSFSTNVVLWLSLGVHFARKMCSVEGAVLIV